MKRDHFRSVGLAVVGALVGAGLAVMLVGHPFCDRGLHTREHKDCSKVPPPSSEQDGRGPSSDLQPWTSTQLQRRADSGTRLEEEGAGGGTAEPAVQRSQQVFTLPDELWPLSLVAAPVPWRGRASDLSVSTKGRVAYVYGDGRQSVLVTHDEAGSALVLGSEGAHSPFFMGEQLWWLRGGDVLHEGQPAVVALTGPGTVRNPVLTPSGGFGLVVGDTSIELFDASAEGQARLDLPERLGGMAWWGEALLFTRFGVGDSDLWWQREGVLSPYADSPLPELRPSADATVWWFQESAPGSFDLVREGQVLEEGVLLPTRQGVSLRQGRAVVASELPGTLLLVSAAGTLELVTGLDWLADPVHVGERVAFAAPGGIGFVGSAAD